MLQFGQEGTWRFEQGDLSQKTVLLDNGNKLTGPWLGSCFLMDDSGNRKEIKFIGLSSGDPTRMIPAGIPLEFFS